MDKIVIIDLALLTIFCIWVVWFLSTRKHNLKREGWMYLYRTQLGVKYIDKFSKKYSKLLYALRYPIILLGTTLMAIMIFLLLQTVYIYIKFPQITQIIKAPPIMPLIPYFPQIFGVESLMPPFYFMYFLIALIIVAVVHEFAHGIYMKLFGVRIKSTGFVFLGPILGAFVEQNEADLIKKSRRNQMTVLAAGVFANMLFALIFYVLLVGFFYAAYSPAGYVFSDYAYSGVALANITGFSNITHNNLTEVYTNYNRTYLFAGNVSLLENAIQNNNLEYIMLYEEAPAIKAGITGIITQIDDVEIKNRQDLTAFLEGKNPGEKISIITKNNYEINKYELTLTNHPQNSSEPFLGILGNSKTPRGIFSKILISLTTFKDTATYYEEKYFPTVTLYIYNLLWWVMMINMFVGLFNMLPLGILDGGRFFYLAIYGVVNKLGLSKEKSEKIAKRSFAYISLLIGLIFIAMIISWVFAL